MINPGILKTKTTSLYSLSTNIHHYYSLMTGLPPILYHSVEAVYVRCLSSFRLLLPFPPQYLCVVRNRQSRPKLRWQHVLEARMLSSSNVLCPWAHACLGCVFVLVCLWCSWCRCDLPPSCVRPVSARAVWHTPSPQPLVCCKFVMCLLESSRCAEGRR